MLGAKWTRRRITEKDHRRANDLAMQGAGKARGREAAELLRGAGLFRAALGGQSPQSHLAPTWRRSRVISDLGLSGLRPPGDRQPGCGAFGSFFRPACYFFLSGLGTGGGYPGCHSRVVRPSGGRDVQYRVGWLLLSAVAQLPPGCRSLTSVSILKRNTTKSHTAVPWTLG